MIFITGDTHGDIRWLESDIVAEITKGTNKEDNYLIVCGDFGFLFDEKETENNKLDFQIMGRLPFKKILFVDGNHENHARLNRLHPIEWNGGKVGVVREYIYHLKRGEYYTIQDKTFWCFGGGYSYDQAWRREKEDKELLRLMKYDREHVSSFKHWLWWPEEEPTQDEINHGKEVLKQHNNRADYIITHEAPLCIVKNMYRDKTEGSVNEKFFDWVKDNVGYKQWYCGHYHREEYHDTVRLNILYHNFVSLKKDLNIS